jgi:ABC-2 type transport system ATP-binding protein
VLLTTHYMEEAERLCDRVAVVDHGKIMQQGTPRGLIDAHVGTPEGTLEDVFVALTGRSLREG